MSVWRILEGVGIVVVLAVVIHGVPVQQTTHSNPGISGTVLGREHAADIRVARQDAGFSHFVQAGAGDTLSAVLERLGVEALGIEFFSCHDSIILSYFLSLGFRPAFVLV